MSVTSLPSELKIPCIENLQSKNSSFLASKSFVRVPWLSQNENFQSLNRDVRVAVSGHLMPGRLEESFMERKRPEEPTRKLEFVRTLLIDNYDSYTYNIYQELSVVNGVPPVVVRNDELTWEDVCHLLYEEKAFDNIIISPGPGSPSCPSDIGICLQLLLKCTDIPILGVCLGHQALGYVHGARVVHASEPVHGRLSEIEHNSCRLFHNIPSGRNSGYKVVRYHSLVIDAESLPKELIPIAWTSSICTGSFLEDEQSPLSLDAPETNIGKNKSNNCSPEYGNGSPRSVINSEDLQGRVIMGIMHSTRPHYGLQFHPESVATSYGRQIFKNFREITEDYWLTSGSSLTDKSVHYNGASFQSAI